MKCLFILVSLAVAINAVEMPVGQVTAKVPVVADKEKITTPMPVPVPVPVPVPITVPVIAPVAVPVHIPHIVADKDKPVVPPKQPIYHIIDHGQHKVPTIPPNVQHVVDQVHQHIPQVISHHVSMVKSMPQGTDKAPPPHHGQHHPIHVDITHHQADGHKHTAHNVPHGSGVPTVPVSGVHQHHTVPPHVVDKVHKVEQHIQEVMQQAHQHIPPLVNQQIAQQKEKEQQHAAHHHHVPATHVPPHSTPASVATPPIESVEPVVPAVVHHPVVNVEKPAVM